MYLIDKHLTFRPINIPMIKAGCLLTALLMFFTINQVSAQSHVIKDGSLCRYAKNSLRSKHIDREGRIQCPACDKEDAKEKIARQAEDKRREDVKAAALAAEDLAKKKALEAELKRKREADKGVTEVAVTMPANKGQNSTPSSDNKDKDHEMVKNYFYAPGQFDNRSVSSMIFSLNGGLKNGSTYQLFSDENYFIVNNRKILDNDEFRICVGVREPRIFGNNTTNFPPNIGIVVLNEPGEDHVISDLVDATGKRLLNDNKISTILHFVDDYFILLEGKYYAAGSYPATNYHFPNGVIYNHKTKQRYPIEKYQLTNRAYVNIAWVVGGTYLDKQKLRDKSTYKTFLEIHTGSRKSLVYYITNDGKLETDEINF